MRRRCVGDGIRLRMVQLVRIGCWSANVSRRDFRIHLLEADNRPVSGSAGELLPGPRGVYLRTGRPLAIGCRGGLGGRCRWGERLMATIAEEQTAVWRERIDVGRRHPEVPASRRHHPSGRRRRRGQRALRLRGAARWWPPMRLRRVSATSQRRVRTHLRHRAVTARAAMRRGGRRALEGVVHVVTLHRPPRRPYTFARSQREAAVGVSRAAMTGLGPSM